jgi:hypothetical protein
MTVRARRAESAVSATYRSMKSLYTLVRPEKKRLRDRQAKRLRGSKIDHQLELRRLLDG